MKNIIALMLLLVSFSAGASDEWTTSDTVHQLVFTGLSIADARFTQDAKRHKNLAEENPVLSKYPSNARINTYFASVI